MATLCLYAFIVLYSSLKGSYGESYRCELLEERTCFGSRLDYNNTTTDLVTDSLTQHDVKEKLKQWEGLKFLSRCWSVLQPLLCQVYKPRCYNSSVQLPCREQCLATRKPCSVVERYHEQWPEFLRCERFPLGGCRGGSVSWGLNCAILKMYILVCLVKHKGIFYPIIETQADDTCHMRVWRDANVVHALFRDQALYKGSGLQWKYNL